MAQATIFKICWLKPLSSCHKSSYVSQCRRPHTFGFSELSVRLTRNTTYANSWFAKSLLERKVLYRVDNTAMIFITRHYLKHLHTSHCKTALSAWPSRVRETAAIENVQGSVTAHINSVHLNYWGWLKTSKLYWSECKREKYIIII